VAKAKKAKNAALEMGHITNLNQSIFSFDIYVFCPRWKGQVGVEKRFAISVACTINM
jgi:hypothetical protein